MIYWKKYIKYKNRYLKLKSQIAGFNNEDNQYEINYNKRIYLYNKFKKYNFDIYNDCIMEDKDRYHFIAKGGSGSIYKVYVNLNNNQIPITLKYQIVKTENIYNSKSWRELIILQESTKLVLEKKTQNLPILYQYKLCNSITNSEKNKIIYYNEFADGNFLEWLYKPHSELEWKSFLFQFWCGVYTLQTRMGLVHNDLRLPNILFFYTQPKKKKYWRYILDSNNYYVPDTGYVFIISDFGSSYTLKLNKKKYNEIKAKINGNTDLTFVHDLYKRMKVLAITNKYTLNELKNFFKNDDEKKYLKNTIEYNKKRFDEKRLNEKLKISLAYYIVEKNKFDEVYYKKKECLDPYKDIKFPPKNIIKILKELSDKYNLQYEELYGFYKRGHTIPKKIPSPKFLIEKYCSEFKKIQNYELTFYI